MKQEKNGRNISLRSFGYRIYNGIHNAYKSTNAQNIAQTKIYDDRSASSSKVSNYTDSVLLSIDRIFRSIFSLKILKMEKKLSKIRWTKNKAESV